MVDVGRQHGTSGGNLLTDEFRCDVGVDAQLLAVHVLADGDVLHFRGDDALLGIIHLRAALAFFGAVGQGDVFEAQVVEAVVVPAHLPVLGRDGVELLDIAASGNPAFTHTGKAFLQVDFHIGVAEGAAGVINVHRSIGGDDTFAVDNFYGRREVHLLHAYTDERIHGPLHIGFLCMCVCFVFCLLFHDSVYLYKVYK